MAKNPNNDTASFRCTPFLQVGCISDFWGAFPACGVHSICQRCTPGCRHCTPAIITAYSVKSGLCLCGTPARLSRPEPDTDCSWCQRYTFGFRAVQSELNDYVFFCPACGGAHFTAASEAPDNVSDRDQERDRSLPCTPLRNQKRRESSGLLLLLLQLLRGRGDP